MSEKTLKFNNIRVNKKKFDKSKQPIDLKSVNVDQIVISDKFRHTDDGFKYFIVYQESEFVKPLCIILFQMSGYIKYFKISGKNMCFFVRDDVLDIHNIIWDKTKEKLNIKFYSQTVYDQKYLKVKAREIDSVIKTNFLGDEVRKENMRYTFIACVAIDSVKRTEIKIIHNFI